MSSEPETSSLISPQEVNSYALSLKNVSFDTLVDIAKWSYEHGYQRLAAINEMAFRYDSFFYHPDEIEPRKDLVTLPVITLPTIPLEPTTGDLIGAISLMQQQIDVCAAKIEEMTRIRDNFRKLRAEMFERDMNEPDDTANGYFETDKDQH